jgi:hypothetical protein
VGLRVTKDIVEAVPGRGWLILVRSWDVLISHHRLLNERVRCEFHRPLPRPKESGEVLDKFGWGMLLGQIMALEFLLGSESIDAMPGSLRW